jgi:hypothetical protein
MKLATIALLGIAFLAPFASMQADDKASTDPAGAGQVVLAYNNGGSSTGDICIWYPLFIRDLTLQSLFAAKIGKPLTPSVDKEHAYLIWVSDYSGVQVDSHGVFTLFLIPTGTATIYFTAWPESRDWTNLEHNNRSTWGQPVAKFVRQAGIFQSLDPLGNTGTLINTAELVSSKPFTLAGRTFDFKNLIPYGMTCSETLSGSEETGTCVAVGSGK